MCFKKQVGRASRRGWIVSAEAACRLGKIGDGDAKRTTEHIHDDIVRDTATMCLDDQWVKLTHGDVTIAAITSCTNTSNPSVMVAAGLLAKKAVELGLRVPPYVKTSLAPGSRVVTDYLDKAGLTPYLDQLGFNTVGYGCTTCIGNSGPLPEAIATAVEKARSGGRGGAFGESEF